MLRLFSRLIAPHRIRPIVFLARPFAGLTPAPGKKVAVSGDLLEYQIQELSLEPRVCMNFCKVHMQHLNTGHILQMVQRLHEYFSEVHMNIPYQQRIMFIKVFKLLYKLYFVQDNWPQFPNTLGALLEVYSSGELRNEEILDQSQLPQFEKHIVDNLPQFYDVTLDRFLGIFLRMNYIPNTLIKTLKEIDANFMLFGKRTIFYAAEKFLSIGALDGVLLERICKRTNKLLSILDISDILDGLSFLADVFVSETYEENKDLHPPFNKLVDILIKEAHVRAEKTVISPTNKLEVILLIDELGLSMSHMDFIYPLLESIRRVSMDKLDLEDVIDALRQFIKIGYPNYKEFCVKVWKQFITKKFVLETLNISDQAVLVEALGCSLINIKALYNVITHDIFSKDFTVNSAVRTLYGFAKGGYIQPSIPSVVSALVMRKLREDKKGLKPSMLVKLVWALCVTHGLDEPNPITLPLLQQMCTKGRGLPLTSNELLDMHQIVGYIELMVEKGHWPDEVKGWINNNIKEKAEAYYKEVDERPYPEIQAEIAKALKENEIEFVRDTYVKKMLKPDLIIKDKKAVIVIDGNEVFNEDKKLRGAETMMFFEASEYKVFHINGEIWKSWSAKDKKEKLKTLVRSIKAL